MFTSSPPPLPFLLALTPSLKKVFGSYIETNVLIVNAHKMTVNIGDLIRAEVFSGRQWLK